MELSLKEKFLILSIEPDKGKILLMGNQLSYGLACAILFELKIKSIVDFLDNKLLLKVYRPSTDKVINKAVDLVRKARKNRNLNSWIMRFSYRARSFLREIIRDLLANNILRKDRRKFLNIFPYNRYFFLQKNVRHQIILSLQDSIYTGNYANNEENRMLLGLIYACSLELVMVSDKSEKKALAKKLKELIDNNEAYSELKPVLKKLKTAIAHSRSSPTGV